MNEEVDEICLKAADDVRDVTSVEERFHIIAKMLKELMRDEAGYALLVVDVGDDPTTNITANVSKAGLEAMLGDALDKLQSGEVSEAKAND